MSESAKSIGMATVQLFAKLLMILGGLIFLAGDKFLEEFLHFSFFMGEVVGILSGLLLCGLGITIGKWVRGEKTW